MDALGGLDLELERAAYRVFWAPLKEQLLEIDPALLKGRTDPKSLWLTINSPIPHTFIAAEIGSGEIRVVLNIDTGDRMGNLDLLGQLKGKRAVLEAEVEELDFLEGKHRCKVVKRLASDGKLLTQHERHDEARAWLYENLRGFRRGLEAAAPFISSP